MPVITRSSTRPAPAVAAHAPSAHSYNLRSERPASGFYNELTAEDVATAETLVSMRSSASVPAPVRRSARLAQRS